MKSVFPVAFSASLLLVPVLVPVAGCNSDEADDTVLEASRSERISNFADAVCDRYEACNNGFDTSNGQPYASEADCEAFYENRAAQAWPEGQCNDRQIDDSNYDNCINQVKQYVCSSGFESFADGLDAIAACNAASVCTDAAN